MILGQRWRTFVAAAVVTVLTIAIIGTVLFSTTPLGCGPAKALHIKMSSNRCATVASTMPSPSPFTTGPQAPSPGQPNPNPNPNPASSGPYPPPASSGQYPPYYDPASQAFPPFPTQASGPPTAGLQVNCRLPVFAGGPGSGGFVVFPNGNFIADPRSAVTAPSPSPGPSPTPPGYGYGYQGWWGATYDRAYSRWLPVPYAWVSPDGKRYAYPGQSDGIYVQNITNGTQVEVGEGKPWQLLDLEATGAYAISGSTGGLWFLALSGTVTQITTSGYWTAINGGFAYGTVTSQVPQGAGNTILRLNLSNGTTTDYFAIPTVASSVAGFDYSGHPVIYAQTSYGLQIWLATAPNVATEIANLNGTNFYPNGAPVADSHGLWLGGGSGIALYVAGHGWYYMSSIGGQLAGGCY